MTRWLAMRHLLVVAVLVFAWCALWGEASVANVASGLIVSAVALVGSATVRRPTSDSHRMDGRVHVRPLVRLVGLVAVDIARSTLHVAQEVLTPTDHTDEAIVAVKLPPAGRRHLLILVLGITVTPGTAVIDARSGSDTIYLHLLHRERRAEAEAQVLRLADLADAAFPTDLADRTERHAESNEGSRP